MTKSRSKISRQAIKKSPASKVPRSGGSHKGVAASAAKGKWVYSFGGGAAEGRASMRNLLGGKGAGLAEMAKLGLPVPPGFTITTEGCNYFYPHDKSHPGELREQVERALAGIEHSLGARFGDPDN